jgi:dienelactone hydrolase
VSAVPGFEATPFAHGGWEHQVYRAGAGPAVVVIHEIPGLHPGVIAFGQRLVDAGYRVYLPSLFGRPGAPATGGAIFRTGRRSTRWSRSSVSGSSRPRRRIAGQVRLRVHAHRRLRRRAVRAGPACA